MVVQCKAVLQQARTEEVRRFEFQDNDFLQLQRVISQLFPALSEAPFAVFWQDDDDDFVSISCDEELRIAIASTSEPLRLYVRLAENSRWKCSSKPSFKTPTHRWSRALRGGLLMLIIGTFIICNSSFLLLLLGLFLLMKYKNQVKRVLTTSYNSGSGSGCLGLSSSGWLLMLIIGAYVICNHSFLLILLGMFMLMKHRNQMKIASPTSCDNAFGSDPGCKDWFSRCSERDQTRSECHPFKAIRSFILSLVDAGPQISHHGTDSHTWLAQPPREDHAAQPPREDQAAQPTRGEPADPAQPVYGLYPVIESHVTTTVQQLKQMGFSDEGGWLTQLVVAKDGDVGRVLDELQPNCRRGRGSVRAPARREADLEALD